MSIYQHLSDRLYGGDFNYAFNISLKHKYVYVENAKAACTAVKSILGEWEFSESNLGNAIPQAYLDNVHINVVGTPFVKPFQLGQALFDGLIDNDEYLRFSFVRNPYARLLSAYLDKIVRQKPESEQIFQEASRLGFEDTAEDFSFLSFLRTIASLMQQELWLDKHWRPQALQLAPEHIFYQFVGKVETFEDDIQRLADVLGFKRPTTEREYGHETQARSRLTDYYDDQTQALVQTLYASDFITFGYDSNVLA
jgi:hypothetical protein